MKDVPISISHHPVLRHCLAQVLLQYRIDSHVRQRLVLDPVAKPESDHFSTVYYPLDSVPNQLPGPKNAFPDLMPRPPFSFGWQTVLHLTREGLCFVSSPPHKNRLWILSISSHIPVGNLTLCMMCVTMVEETDWTRT